MLKEPSHLSDQEILLVIDGEASRRCAKRAHAHLTACWSCRARWRELEGTIADFVSLRRRTPDSQMPDASGPRALLKARLAETAAMPSTHHWHSFLQLHPPYRTAACLCLAMFLTVMGGMLHWKYSQWHGPGAANLSVASLTIPDHKLTPGAIRSVSIGDVCSMPHEEVVRDVPNSLRQEVFKEYGIVNPRTEDYEIDYLIAPGLGGTDDIHNLWPEPSTPSVWNAHVKDALEERLHQLVCDGELDLPTAQRAIATNWITAYKQYFGGNRSVSQSVSQRSIDSAPKLNML
jgi:hypothetical protein